MRSLIAKNARFKQRQEKWEKRTSTPDPHVGGENGKETIVYNMKKGKEKKQKKKEKKKKKKDLSILKS